MKQILSVILVFAFFVLLGTPDRGWTAPRDVTITVNTLEDEYNGDGDCSLREAMTAANQNTPVDVCPGGGSSGVDTINFSVSGSIPLFTTLPPIQNGSLTIDGGDQVQVSAANSGGAFLVYYGGDLVLRNLTIRDGVNSVPGSSGTGLQNDGGTVVIENCSFLNNIADGADSKGGAISNTNGGGLAISNSTFEDNYAYLGGAIYSNATLNITGSTFRGNSGQAEGGAVYILGDSVISGSSFEENVAYSYGGAIYSSAPAVSISSSTFTNNMVFGTGGAIMCSYGTCTIETSSFTGSMASSGGAICSYTNKLYVSGSLFRGNAVTDYGGAIELWNVSDFSISSTTFDENTATIGGGVFIHRSFGNVIDSLLRKNNAAAHGGGIYHESDDLTASVLTVERTTLWENNAKQGGAIYNVTADLTLLNDTLASNTAEDGGGIYNTISGRVVIRHSTLAYNSAMFWGDQVHNRELGEVYVISSILAFGNIMQNCYGTIIDEGMNIDTGNECKFNPNLGSYINADPLLGPLQDNGGPGVPDYPTLTFAIHYGSPAINHSDPSYSNGVDQRGFWRRHNVSDIGAYEAQPFVFNIVHGDDQSTYVNTAFPEPLVIEAQDEYGNRLAGVFVHLLGPNSGPSITNDATDLVTDESGYVSFQAIANDQAGGPYKVWAMQSLGTVYTTFHLTNLGVWKDLFLPMVIR